MITPAPDHPASMYHLGHVAPDPDGSYCPQISANLVGGQTYFIVITSYAPNMTVSDGVNMCVWKPSAVDFYARWCQSIRQTLPPLKSFRYREKPGNVNEKFMDGATKRHFSNVSGFWEEVYTNSQLISDDEGPNDILKITEDFVEIDWSEKQIKETYNKKRFIFETYVEHQKRHGIQEHADLNLKFAEESFNKTDRTNGISIELQSNFQKASNFTDAEFRHINLLLGGYSIQSLGKNFCFSAMRRWVQAKENRR